MGMLGGGQQQQQPPAAGGLGGETQPGAAGLGQVPGAPPQKRDAGLMEVAQHYQTRAAAGTDKSNLLSMGKDLVMDYMDDGKINLSNINTTQGGVAGDGQGGQQSSGGSGGILS